MATLGLDDDELKSVEQLVARLAQLSSSIQSLKMDILKSNPLPHASSLQASAQILQRNLQTVLDSLAENADLFGRMALHPATNYPGRTQEGVLTQLLRKKLEPDVEELVVEGREAARLATAEGIAALQAIWDELRQWTHERIATYVRDEAGQVFTAEERAAGTETEEEEEEDAAAVVRARLERGPEPETLLWFAARGDFELPRNVEYERKVGVNRGLEGVNIPPEEAVPDATTTA
ncbi:hypothetical protein GQ602_003310 [Ophiocordyceps camponoti-floridani]|uniref:Mediator of RNA polymerase II transcription subunit 8 n=1 Tax=Ophiocordyceps camponoti-floridani TaxID=2030778 RepID=A0A8H4Q7Y3_9HYPO|nr:hypothetical protein GQ602_003310 [Ophiocordyceps camponoti-floridani]